nr:unnamed protein product [Callosobruchus chinensis]
MESHYCRKSSSREYLHPNLNLTKMFDMFVEEYSSRTIKTTYRRIWEGQNKNSVVASMLLHTVCSLKKLKCISLAFFVPCHRQNEVDSAHSAINSAMNKAAEIMVPSQLIPVCRLARKKNPYLVHALTTENFLDYKSLAAYYESGKMTTGIL